MGCHTSRRVPVPHVTGPWSQPQPVPGRHADPPVPASPSPSASGAAPLLVPVFGTSPSLDPMAGACQVTPTGNHAPDVGALLPALGLSPGTPKTNSAALLEAHLSQ